MSDYMFMLENHLTADQSRAVAQVSAAAAEAGMSLFLTGGAIRDMIGGFPVRDLDFTAEGNALKLGKSLAQIPGVEVLHVDEHRKSTHFQFPGGVTVELAMARQERYPKPGAKPQISPATIHEDLRCRDFTVNALGLSLNRASRGLLLDPNNGLSEIDRKELRAVGNYTLYDSPIRLLRLIRFKVRFGFQIAERTQSQYENVRETGIEKNIPAPALLEEARQISREPNIVEVIQTLDQEKLLTLLSPDLSGAKINEAGFTKLQKAKSLLPFGIDLHVDSTALFFNLLTEKFSTKERADFVAHLGIEKEESETWQKLDVKAKKLEKDLMASKLQKASALYQVLVKVPGEQILYLLIKSTQRLVQDRLKNYLQKHLVTAQEVTDEAVTATTGVVPGTPKFEKTKQQMINAKVDARPKKVVEEPVPEPAPGPPPIIAGGARR